ncbi:MAG: hypothetical protein LAT64_03115 [Phycisphaerales bacterium]|nr:hypothetical protein [Planctomycetota bacterium]MCH8507747.1 hypothetical protein [Phycisphaerales bacterium]
MKRRVSSGIPHGLMACCVVIAAVTGYALFLTDRTYGGFWLNALFLLAIFGVTVAISRLLASGAIGSIERDLQRQHDAARGETLADVRQHRREQE